MRDTDLEQLLRRLADRAPAPTTLPPTLRRRIRRRIGASVLVGAGLVSAAGLGLVLWVGSLGPGTEPQPVGPPTGSPPPTSEPTPSPSEPVTAPGGRIAFLSSRGGVQALNVLRPATGEAKRITETSGYRLSWSPDGREVVFGRGLDEGHGELVIVSVATSKERVVITDRGKDDPLHPQSPAWSPTGDLIVFNDTTGRIYTISPQGGPLRQLSRPVQPCVDHYPAWSPDGDRIAFTRYCEGTEEIMVMDADGTGLRAVTEGPQDHYAAWSPDGAQLAFARSQGGEWQLMLLHLEDLSVRQLTRDGENTAPTWSPDGSAIAFVSNRHGHSDLYVIRSDGTGESRLTESAGSDFSPAWTE